METIQPDFAGKLTYRLFPFRKKVVLENMKRVYGDSLSAGQIEALAQRFYGHLFRLFMENIRMGWTNKKQLKDQIRIEGHEIVKKATDGKKGALLLTGHFGNWEVCPIAGMMHFEEYRGKFHIVRRQIGNKWVEKILFRRFYEAGLNVIPKRNAIDRVLEVLSQNEVVTFIMDQYAKPGRDGILVDFFGHKAGTFKSLALIASASGAPVIPTISYREPDGKHVMKFFEPLEWIQDDDPDKELYLNTLAYNRVLEKLILDKPDQWIWMHKRWKVKK